MWLLMWAVLATGQSGTVHPIFFRTAQTFASQAACQTYLEATQPRMADYIRGRLDTMLETEVRVTGVCRPNGKPA